MHTPRSEDSAPPGLRSNSAAALRTLRVTKGRSDLGHSRLLTESADQVPVHGEERRGDGYKLPLGSSGWTREGSSSQRGRTALGILSLGKRWSPQHWTRLRFGGWASSSHKRSEQLSPRSRPAAGSVTLISRGTALGRHWTRHLRAGGKGARRTGGGCGWCSGRSQPGRVFRAGDCASSSPAL